MDEDHLLTTTDVADLLNNIPVETVKRWRATRTGPPFMRIGRHVRYSRQAVLEWAASRTSG